MKKGNIVLLGNSVGELAQQMKEVLSPFDVLPLKYEDISFFKNSSGISDLLKADVIIVHFRDLEVGDGQVLEHLIKLNNHATFVLCCDDQNCVKMNKMIRNTKKIRLVEYKNLDVFLPEILNTFATKSSWWSKRLKSFLSPKNHLESLKR